MLNRQLLRIKSVSVCVGIVTLAAVMAVVVLVTIPGVAALVYLLNAL